MTPLELSEAAIADLAEILEYGVATFGEQTGEDYVAGFESAFALIAEHPMAGAVHDFVRPPIRSLAHGRHRIYYDFMGTSVIVQRILHHAMDIQGHL